MKPLERQTRSHLMKLFERHGFHPRTDLGQNFLIDFNILEFIVEAAEIEPRDVILEVGTGTGGLTSFLAPKAAHVVSVEVDPRVQQIAQHVVGNYPNVTLLRTDVLKNKNRFAAPVLEAVANALASRPDARLKLVANLPYNVATPVVSNLAASDLPWACMVVTIQLELAQKMAARVGDSNYGALSVWLQAQCNVQFLKRLGPTVFWPRPKVNSAIIKLTPDPARRDAIRDRAFFQDFLRRLFTQRRKLMRGVLAGMYRKQLSKAEVDAILAELDIPASARAEETDVETLVGLCNRLHAAVDAARPRQETACGTE